MKPSYLIFIVLALICPISFVGISDQHDWGDDFAQYLDQTRDFLEGEENENLLNGEDYSPDQRGGGFSLLLAIPYGLFGHDISSTLTFLSIIYLLLGLVLFKFYQSTLSRYKSPLTPILLTLVFIYNYHVLGFKLEILPLFPFMLLLYGILILLEQDKKTNWSFIYIGILTGLLISFKVIGLTLYTALIIKSTFSYFKSKPDIAPAQLTSIITIPIAMLVTIQWIVFDNIPNQNIAWYNDVFTLDEIVTTLFNNLSLYWLTAQQYFEQEVWGWANVLIAYSILFSFSIGFVQSIRNKLKLYDLFFVAYIIVLLVYPYNSSSHRFLTPLIPLILLYAVNGINHIRLFNQKQYATILFLLMLWSSNYIQVKNFVELDSKNILGPEQPEAQEVFEYVNSRLPIGERVAFSKPFVVHYYAGRTSQFVELESKLKDIEVDLDKTKCYNLLLCKDSNQSEVYNEQLLLEIIESKSFSLRWENDKFSLWKFNTPLR